MKTECERYLSDPEAHEAHLERCEECRALFAPPAVAARPLSLERLPLAPWEGASERRWAVVIIAAVVTLGGAAALFAAAGVQPIHGLAAVLRGSVPPIDALRTLLPSVGGALQRVPLAWQIALAAAFVAVNMLLVALLRKAPKGIDV